MPLGRFRSFALASAFIALPLAAQVGGPYSGPDVFAPAGVAGASRFHVVSNEGKPGQQQLTYFSTGRGGLTKLEVLGGKTSGPAVVYDADGLHVFVIDTTGRLSHRLRSAAGTWGAWTVVPKGSRLRGRPAAAIYGGLIYVFVIGGDGNIWYTTGNKETFGAAWTRMPDLKTTQSPTAMADGKRMMVVGISPNTSLGLYQQFSNGKWSVVRGLYVDPANAPKGALAVAAGDKDNEVLFASAIYVPANSMMVGSAFADMPKQYDPEAQLDAVIMAHPALTRNEQGHQVILARGVDGLLWYREFINDQWSGWGKLAPPR
jgi:hypothetical protein